MKIGDGEAEIRRGREKKNEKERGRKKRSRRERERKERKRKKYFFNKRRERNLIK